MWSGSIATIPSGWVLCDGQNGTPDLRDKFIIGASQDSANVARTNVTGSLTLSGGSPNAVIVSHTHTATSTAVDSGHAHPLTITGIGSGGGSGEFTGANDAPAPTSKNNRVLNGTANITVTTTIQANGVSGLNQNLPPYYALAYIMNFNAPNSNQNLDLSIYAPKASPSFTGTPVAPTAAEKTSSNALATTSFVDRLRSLSTPTTGSSGTLQIGDRGSLVVATGTITVPANVFGARDIVTVFNDSAANISLNAGTGLTLLLAGTATTGNRTLQQKGLVTIVFVSSTTAIVSGNGVQ
jgi:hypothetical protein